MITFNTLLNDSQIDPRDVQLVRHQDKRSKEKITPYSLWLDDETKSEFERYQCLQKLPKFRVGKYIASFVVTPKKEVLFVGLYRVLSRKKAPKGTISPISRVDCSNHYNFDLALQEKMSEYTGLVTVDWSKGARSWVQRAWKNEKPIREIRTKHKEEEWPGFRNFSWDLKRIKSTPKSWQDILTRTQGIYILTCQQTGMKYVGSAKSEDGGFWQRFCSYENGHGGNKELKTFDTSHMLVSILERVDPGTSQIEDVEQMWKKKLLTRMPLGLNAN